MQPHRHSRGSYCWVGDDNLRITSSRLKLAGFCRIGYSLKLWSHDNRSESVVLVVTFSTSYVAARRPIGNRPSERSAANLGIGLPA